MWEEMTDGNDDIQTSGEEEGETEIGSDWPEWEREDVLCPDLGEEAGF
jgi:hypothetical protein